MPKSAENNNQINEFSFDFSKKIPHFYQDIFRHLEVNDLKECSLVNVQWNHLIGTTPECMAKIKIKIDQATEPEAKEVLLKSSRNYANIEISCYKIDQYTELFKKCEGHWKSVKILWGKVSEDCLNSIMKSVEATIEELKIIFILFIPSLQPLDQTMTFKNLKALTFAFVDIPLSTFAGCKKLTYLAVRTAAKVDVNIRHLLQNNSELKIVWIVGNELQRVFDDILWRKISFKLDKLDIDRWTLTDTATPPFMTQFLKTQFGNLTSLRTRGGMDLKCLELIFKMPKLNDLRIVFQAADLGANWDLDWNLLELPQNSTIERLTFNRSEDDDDKIKAFLRSAPNIKELELDVVSDEVFSFLRANDRILESLKCKVFNVSRAVLADNRPFPMKTLEVGREFGVQKYNEEDLRLLRATLSNHVSNLIK